MSYIDSRGDLEPFFVMVAFGPLQGHLPGRFPAGSSVIREYEAAGDLLVRMNDEGQRLTTTFLKTTRHLYLQKPVYQASHFRSSGWLDENTLTGTINLTGHRSALNLISTSESSGKLPVCAGNAAF
jgi:hypothetical protein